MKRFFVVSINGQKAVDIARGFCDGFCYRVIKADGKFIGQLEVVVDEPGFYKGLPNKWVDISYIETGEDVKRVLDRLSEIGFRGCPCLVSECVINECFDENTELCSMII